MLWLTPTADLKPQTNLTCMSLHEEIWKYYKQTEVKDFPAVTSYTHIIRGYNCIVLVLKAYHPTLE